MTTKQLEMLASVGAFTLIFVVVVLLYGTVFALATLFLNWGIL